MPPAVAAAALRRLWPFRYKGRVAVVIRRVHQNQLLLQEWQRQNGSAWNVLNPGINTAIRKAFPMALPEVFFDAAQNTEKITRRQSLRTLRSAYYQSHLRHNWRRYDRFPTPARAKIAGRRQRIWQCTKSSLLTHQESKGDRGAEELYEAWAAGYDDPPPPHQLEGRGPR